jgi:hypothetical protein
MASQWENFLRNLGEWRGTFTNLAADGTLLESTPSLLTLERGEEERLVHFRLLRYRPGEEGGEPTRQISQEYRSLGRQVVFFDSGSFCKGSLQVAPGTTFGAEFGFVVGDRRHRLVQLHTPEGALASLVLIREFRSGTDASERPPLAWEQLEGVWSGQAATVMADWPEPTLAPCRFAMHRHGEGGLRITAGGGSQSEGSGEPVEERGLQGERALLLPDSGYCLAPPQVSHRSAFVVEAGWLPAPNRLERLIRHYDASGAWQSATWIQAHRDEGAGL